MDEKLLDVQKQRTLSKSKGNTRFREGPPLNYSKQIAIEYNCDIAVPNGDGIGNVVCYSRVVEELARKKGRAIRILTAPLKPLVGTTRNEADYPIWENNPFICEIVNTNDFDTRIINEINSDQDNCFQYAHFIQNLCFSHKVRHDIVSPSLFLTEAEQTWALDQLNHLKRPVVCIHPSGTSSADANSDWYSNKWKLLASEVSNYAGLIQLGKAGFDVKDIGVLSIPTTIREMMAIIWASDIFVGFDSGPAHIARAFRKPSAVVWDIAKKNAVEEHAQEGFGPSAMTRWSYPQNFNLMLLGEKDNEALELLVQDIKTKAYKFNGG